MNVPVTDDDLGRLFFGLLLVLGAMWLQLNIAIDRIGTKKL